MTRKLWDRFSKFVYWHRFGSNTHIMEWNDRIDKVQKDDAFKPGVLKLVKFISLRGVRYPWVTRWRGDTATKESFPRFYRLKIMPHLDDGRPVAWYPTPWVFSLA